MFARLSHSDPKDSRPRKDPNVVGLLQGVDRVVDNLEQEVTNHFANPFGEDPSAAFPVRVMVIGKM